MPGQSPEGSSSVMFHLQPIGHNVSCRLHSKAENCPSVLAFSLCLVDRLAAFYMKQESCSNVHLVSAVNFLWDLHVQFIQHKVKQSRQEQYIVQMASLAILEANSITPFFKVHLFNADGITRSSCTSLSRKTLNHFKCHIL